MPSSETEKAWAAGFFDGEGSVHIAWRHLRKDGTEYCYPQVSLSQSGLTAKAILERFGKAVEVPGKLYGPKPPAKNQRQVRFLWEANGIVKTRQIFEVLFPYLSMPKITKFNLILSLATQKRKVA